MAVNVRQAGPLDGFPANPPDRGRQWLLRVGQREEGAAPDIALEMNRGFSYQIVVRTQEEKQHVLGQLARYPGAAVVAPDGGLIGNLKVWENLALPGDYHGVARGGELEREAVEIFCRCGLDRTTVPDLVHRLPGALSLFEKRLVAFVRAMLREPELMVYDSVFDGLAPGEADRVRGFNRLFRLYFPFRTSVYLGFDAQSEPDVGRTFMLGGS